MGLSDDKIFNTLLYSIGTVLITLVMLGSIFLIQAYVDYTCKIPADQLSDAYWAGIGDTSPGKNKSVDPSLR